MRCSPRCGGGVFIDDLAMSRDAQALTPKFTVAVQTPSAQAVEGSTVDVPVSVRRYNGSTGSVTLSVGSLPSKIESTQFLPNASATGTNPVTLRIRSKRPNAETQQLSVNGSPGSGSAGVYSNASDPTVSVTGITAIYFATGGRFPIRLVPGCGQQVIDDSFNVRGGFSGYTDYNFGGTLATSGLNVANTFSDSVPFPSGDGTYPFQYKLDPGSGDGSGSFTVHMQPYGATPVDLKLNWLSDRLSVDHVSDKAPALPLKEGGNTIRVIGNFPLNCPVKFKDSLDQEWTVREHDQTEVNGKLLDDYLLNMPSTAVSGPLRALNKAGVEMARTADLDVREFRRTYGMSISNSSAGGSKGTYSWDDFERTFGDDDTDACFIVCVHDPVASDYYDQFKASVEAGTGLCFGYADDVARFRGYNSGQRFSDYQPGATARLGHPRLRRLGHQARHRPLVRRTERQDVPDLPEHARPSRSPAAEKTLLKDLINEQGGAMIGIRPGTERPRDRRLRRHRTGDGGMIRPDLRLEPPLPGVRAVEQGDARERARRAARSRSSRTARYRTGASTNRRQRRRSDGPREPAAASTPSCRATSRSRACSPRGRRAAPAADHRHRGRRQGRSSTATATRSTAAPWTSFRTSPATARCPVRAAEGAPVRAGDQGSGKGGYDSSLLPARRRRPCAASTPQGASSIT